MGTRPLVADVRTLLATAYLTDPLIHWLFSGVDEPQHATAAWLSLFVERYLAHGTVDPLFVDGDLAAVALWRLPDPGPEDAPVAAGSSPAAPVPGAVGLPSAAGLYTALVGLERASSAGRALHVLADLAPVTPHAYLHFFVVAPTHHRRGVGSRLLVTGLDRADRRGLDAHLETTNPAAVPFYEAHGFTVHTTVTLDAGGPPLWAMRRPAPARRPTSSTTLRTSSPP
ncbi:GNAT family N-acetyltransferase [Goekera deserti]|uniref:GNAT family N-acetyltransferase n=1 Tax=Goekera deserti TaxID=2497753 RepID=A0A7K3WFT7_9ACTN|nr:GNAT family N-acetyltransferase [Goekera deserti]NDI47251.1 GNAT family N-acetyltransferase [Goekera deserti]NEL55348.1 GNAT family N-acetyltransferase [Goekera deserti]